MTVPVIRSDGRIYRSVTEAAKDNGISKSAMSYAVKKGSKTHGYTFRVRGKFDREPPENRYDILDEKGYVVWRAASIEEAASFCGISVNCAYDYVKKGVRIIERQWNG